MKIRQNGTEAQQELPGGTSFAASHEHVLSFAHPGNEGEINLTISWASGNEELVTVPAEVHSLWIVEGRGAVIQKLPL